MTLRPQVSAAGEEKEKTPERSFRQLSPPPLLPHLLLQLLPHHGDGRGGAAVRNHRQSEVGGGGGEGRRHVSINPSAASNDLAEINNERRELKLSVAISQFISKYNWAQLKCYGCNFTVCLQRSTRRLLSLLSLFS